LFFEGEDINAAWEVMQILNRSIPRPMEVVAESPQNVSIKLGKCPRSQKIQVFLMKYTHFAPD
jgi:hypothetical protein